MTHRRLRFFCPLVVFALFASCAQVVQRDITICGACLKQPSIGSFDGIRGSGSGSGWVDLDGNRMSGSITFYWGAGYKQEVAVLVAASDNGGAAAFGFSQGGQRMCRATFMGSGNMLDCVADVDPNTGHGTGLCLDRNKQEYTWHF